MNSDDQFYDSRAADMLAARDGGDITAAAEVVGQVLLEEGPAGITALTEAIHRAKS